MACFVCGLGYSLEEHHLRLQAEGGTTGKTIDLCGSCHSMCHKAAKALQSKHAKTRARAYTYIPVNLQPRAMVIIKAILEGGLTYEVEKDQFQDHAILNIQVSLSPRQRARLHMLKDKHGFTNLEAFMAAMIAKMTGVKAWPKGAAPNTQPPGDFDL